MSNSEPYVRVLLHPVAEAWSAGPGQVHPSVRFGLASSWRMAATVSPAEEMRSLRLAILIPEMPFSVLPRAVQEAGNILFEEDAPDARPGQPVPLWRGIPCRTGTAYMNVSDECSLQAVEFPIQVLVPQRDPPGPRLEVIYLGMRFLSHYGFRLVWDFAAVRFTARFQVDGTVPAGSLEIP